MLILLMKDFQNIEVDLQIQHLMHNDEMILQLDQNYINSIHQKLFVPEFFDLNQLKVIIKYINQRIKNIQSLVDIVANVAIRVM